MNKQSQISTKIVLTGGGSGGHITPILSLAQEIKAVSPSARLIYIGQKGDNLAGTILNTKLIDEFYSIRAGKWRRYHGESFWEHLKDIRTVFKNIVDLFNVAIGTVQAWILLLKLKPSVIFVKGGFVGLPVGISAKIRGVGFVTHDSDAVPGLTNRIVGRWAKYNAVGMPAELYNYPSKKVVYTGVPINNNFVYVSERLKNSYRHKLGLKSDDKVVFVVGGGLGAQRLNNAVLDIAKNLLAGRPNLHILHITGQTNFENVSSAYKSNLGTSLIEKVQVVDFTNELNIYSGSADVVVMRAGATNLSEMAVQGKACILVPNPQLTAGHQLKNTKFWQSARAVKVYDEATPADNLLISISALLDSPVSAQKLQKNIVKLAKPSASKDIAELLIKLAR